MWLVVLFDLPVKSKTAKREYVRFRNVLQKRGYSMLQYSVYARHCPSGEAVDAERGFLAKRLPPRGQVRLLAVTDRQFAKMRTYTGKKRKPTEIPPPQLALF